MTDDKKRGERDRAIGDLAGRLIRASADVATTAADRIREKSDDFPKAGELLSGAAKLSVRGKEELVTLIANEVRNYIEKLRVGEEVERFLETHELEITLRLKPARRDAGADPDAEETQIPAAADEAAADPDADADPGAAPPA